MARRNPVLLIDADVLRYQLAYSNTKTVQWDEGDDKLEVVNESRAFVKLEEWLMELLEKFKTDEFVLALSCKQHNYRKGLYPDYKAQRKVRPKPALWYALDAFIAQTWPAHVREFPNLEGDDVLGLISTRPVNRDFIVVSIDKDLRTVPCHLYNPNKPDMGVVPVSETEANLFWMTQVLTGDSTDNYPGLPGIGPKRAEEILRPAHQKSPYLTVGEHLSALWDTVVSAYVQRGSTADAALTQARLARILRHGDYTPKTQTVHLWTPPEP
ncbi:MAG: phage exonuclease [Pseudomonadota bacterium]|nr:phage exonuclease [Pseudomonadota bacterium]